MINLEQIKPYFPAFLIENRNHQKLMVKEYLQLMILDYLSTTKFIKKIVFIGGTNLRLLKGIDRFSEDLDFDYNELSENDFMEMTDGILKFISRFGLKVEIRDKESPKLNAFRRSFYFPELAFNLGLSEYKNERFLIKVESQDQKIEYPSVLPIIKGCGFMFKFPVPTDGILCAMKISALLSRQKGRDFYDAIFLLNQTQPDYSFLSKKNGINNLDDLKRSLLKVSHEVDLLHKAKDFEHLLFDKRNAQKILLFEEFVHDL